jgi:hypothetical protein
LPEQAEPLQRAQLVTALSVGIDIIHLRRFVPQLGHELPDLDSALESLARADSAAAAAHLAELDRHLASLGEDDKQPLFVLRERGRILSLCDALVQHDAYFDTGASR